MDKTKTFKIDKALCIAVVLTIISILVYFVIPRPHTTHSNAFLYIAFFVLLLEVLSYVVIFIVKLFLISFRKPLYPLFGTSMVLDVTVILAGILFPFILSL